MSKHSSLVKQIEAFEKLAKFGSRVDFLQSLSQENVNVGDKLVPAVSVLYKAIQNWIKNSAERQGDVPGRPEAGLPAGLRQPVQDLIVLMKNNDYDATALQKLQTTALKLLNTASLGNIGQRASQDWSKSVFPQASYVLDLAKSQASFLNAWQAQNAPLMTSEDKPAEKPVAQTAPVAGKPQKLNQMSKAVSKALVNKLSQLSDGPDRASQLKEIDLGVKTLQNYFKRLQNSNVLNDYLARVDIVSALNKVYNALEHDDLKTVVSLSPDGAGGGVPESPDSKI